MLTWYAREVAAPLVSARCFSVGRLRRLELFPVAPSNWSDEPSGGCLLCGGVYSCLLAVCICTRGEAFQHLTGTVTVAGGAHAPICSKTLRNAPKPTQTPARAARSSARARPSFSPLQAAGPRRIFRYFSPPCVPRSANPRAVDTGSMLKCRRSPM